jgi:hypothetical protein
MSKDVFDKMFSSAVSLDKDFLVDSEARWITRKDDDDADLMANAKIQVRRLGQREVTALVDYKDRRIFCASGYGKPDKPWERVKEIDGTPGLFALFVTEAKIPSTATAAQARNILEGSHQGVAGYEGHSLAEISEVFPELTFWEIEHLGTDVYTSDISRIAGSFVVRSYGQYPLEISHGTKLKLIGIFEGGSAVMPFPLLLQGVLSYSWSALFLDVYRSIEQLYSAPKIEKLAAKFSINCALSDLAEALESFISWRPKEEEALALLLGEVSQPVRASIINAFFKGAGEPPEATPAKCASYIYQLRNSHVHFRPAMKATPMPPEMWDNIISAMCDAVFEVYEKFGHAFLVSRTTQHSGIAAPETATG